MCKIPLFTYLRLSSFVFNFMLLEENRSLMIRPSGACKLETTAVERERGVPKHSKFVVFLHVAACCLLKQQQSMAEHLTNSLMQYGVVSSLATDLTVCELTHFSPAYTCA